MYHSKVLQNMMIIGYIVEINQVNACKSNKA